MGTAGRPKSVSRHNFDVATWIAAWAIATWFWRRDRKPHCGSKGGRDMAWGSRRSRPGFDVATKPKLGRGKGGHDLALVSRPG